MTSAQIVPALLVPFIAWRVYVRVRRNLGPQPWQPRRLAVRVGILGVLSAAFVVVALPYPPALAALGGGLLLGVPLALVGLKLTRFTATAAGKSYTPNPAIGVALIVLFVGRLAYRLLTVWNYVPGQPPPAPPFQSPLTLLIFGLTAGYYLAYYVGVLHRGRRLAPAA